MSTENNSGAAFDRRTVLRAAAATGALALGGGALTGNALAQQGSGGVGFIGDDSATHWVEGREGTRFTLGSAVGREFELSRGCPQSNNAATTRHVAYRMNGRNGNFLNAFLYLTPQDANRLQRAGGSYVVQNYSNPCQQRYTFDWARVSFRPGGEC